jgi:hypothetical protein
VRGVAGARPLLPSDAFGVCTLPTDLFGVARRTASIFGGRKAVTARGIAVVLAAIAFIGELVADARAQIAASGI